MSQTVDNMAMLGGFRETSRGIAGARELLITADGDREDVADVFILITNGPPRSAAENEAIKADNGGKLYYLENILLIGYTAYNIYYV